MNTTTTDTTTGTTLAEQYNASTVARLHTAELVAMYLAEVQSGEFEPGVDELRDFYDNNGTAHDGGELALRRALSELDDQAGEPSDAFREYLDDALSIEATGKHDGVEWRVTGVEVTITYGGPNTWVTWNGSEFLTVRTAWGYDTACEIVEAPGLAQAIGEWADLIQR